MNHLNSVIIEGNVVKQPELREPAQGVKVCNVTLGVNRFFRDKNGDGKEEVSFITVEATNKLAEYATEKCTKGRGVRVVGRLKQDRWKNEAGKWDSRMYVLAEHIEYKPKAVTGVEKTSEAVGSSSETDKKVLEAMKLAEQAAYASDKETSSEEAVAF